MTIGTRQFEAFYRAGNPSADSGHLICFLVSHVCIIIRITVMGILSVLLIVQAVITFSFIEIINVQNQEMFLITKL